jgi:hypothetical protein
MDPINEVRKEKILIGANESEYTILNKNPLIYSIEGSRKIKIISRRAAPKKNRKSLFFGYELVIDGESFQIEHTYRINKNVQSPEHPGHGYTFSGNYIVNIVGDGNHKIELIPLDDFNAPILIRMFANKPFEEESVSNVLLDKNEEQKYFLDFTHEFYELNSQKELLFTSVGEKTISINSRLAMDSYSDEDSYRLRVKVDNITIGTFQFKTSNSGKTFRNINEFELGYWRSIPIEVSDGEHDIVVQLLDENKTVFIQTVEKNN